MDGYGPPSSKSPFGQSTEDSKLIGKECIRFVVVVLVVCKWPFQGGVAFR
jgi:hypothetical protein